MKKRGFINLIIVILIVSSIISVLAECQYKQNVTGVSIPVIYDHHGNKYYDLAHIENQQWSGSAYSFNVKNYAPVNVTLNVSYSIYQWSSTFSGLVSTTLTPYQSYPVSGGTGFNSAYGGVSLGDFNIIYFSNEEVDVKYENMTNTVCRTCGDKICINDGDSCTKDTECGSGYCSNYGNTKGLCGSQNNDVSQNIDHIQTNLTDLHDKISLLETQLNDLQDKINNITASKSSGLGSISGNIGSTIFVFFIVLVLILLGYIFFKNKKNILLNKKKNIKKRR